MKKIVQKSILSKETVKKHLIDCIGDSVIGIARFEKHALEIGKPRFVFAIFSFDRIKETGL